MAAAARPSLAAAITFSADSVTPLASFWLQGPSENATQMLTEETRRRSTKATLYLFY